MSIKLAQLRHLLALDQHGSFVQASSALHISQPALSRSIRALEAIVGAPLFLRDGHGVVPTDLGRVLIGRARQIVRMSDELGDEFIGSQARGVDGIRAGAGPYPAGTIVGTAAARFISEHPQVRLQIDVRNWDELLPRLRSRDLDLFVAETSTLESEPDLVVEPMSRASLYFLARPGHPLAGRQGLTLATMLGYPTVSLGRIPPRVLDPILSAVAQSSSVGSVQHALPTVQCTDLSVAKGIVRASDSVMAASLSSVADELERNELVILGTEPWMQLNYGLVTLQSRHPLVGAIAMFRNCLLDAERLNAGLEESLVARWAVEP